MNLDKRTLALIVIVIVSGLLITATFLVSENYFKPEKKSDISNQKVMSPTSEEDCQSFEQTSHRNQCYIDLAKKKKDESYCEKIEALPGGSLEETMALQGADCYVRLAVIKEDSSLCEKVKELESTPVPIGRQLGKWCEAYFDSPSDFRTFDSEECGFKVTFPKEWKCTFSSTIVPSGDYFEIERKDLSCKSIINVDGIKTLFSRLNPQSHKNEFTLNNYLEKKKKELKKDEDFVGSIKEENIEVDDHKGKKITYSKMLANRYRDKYETKVHDVFLQRKNKVYRIKATIKTTQLSDYKPVFGKILSSFEFIE